MVCKGCAQQHLSLRLTEVTEQEATRRVVISVSVILNVSLCGFSFATWRKKNSKNATTIYDNR